MNKKTRIAFITQTLEVGGIETLILEMCRHLDREKYRPYVISLQKEGRLQREFENSDIPVYTEEKGEGIAWLFPVKLARLFKTLDIDIVHTHNQSPWLYGGIAAKMRGLPLIHTEHTVCDSLRCNVGRWAKIENLLSRITNRITTVACSVSQYMIKEERISADKIKVIYNGIKLGLYNSRVDRANKRRELSVDDGDLVIGNVASLLPKKDQATLLRAFKIVAKRLPSAKLLIAGEGPLKDDLIKLRKDLALEDRVVFLGNRRDVPELLQIFDLFVLSSVMEGFPVVLLEAMAAGLAVIATDVDGNPESVVNGKTGLIVPSKDPQAMAEAIIGLLKDEGKRKEMSKNGRLRVEEYFTFEKMIADYEHIYDSIG